MAKLQTSICDLFGIDYPIFCAGMGGVTSPTLATTVSNAGGVGVLGGTGVEAEQLRIWIKKMKTMTDKPFGVDLLMPQGVPETGGEKELTDMIPKEVTDYVEELKARYKIPEIKGRKFTLTIEKIQEAFDVICEERPACYCSGLGTPKWVVEKAREHGIKVVAIVGTVKAAIRMNEMGVDVIVAQGHEAGGHTGKIGTLALVPQVVDAVSPTPVMAAGSIVDGRGIAAALALGAQGVWVGTRFICTHECWSEWLEKPDLYMDLMPSEEVTANFYQERIIKAKETDTTVTRVYTGKTARMLKNDLIESWEKSGIPTLPMPLQSICITDLIEGLKVLKHPGGIFAASGQGCGIIKDIKSAKDVVEEMADQASQILRNHAGAEIDNA